jgi:AraC-like DNA-binding protein
LVSSRLTGFVPTAAIAQIASRVGYETTAFSKVFRQCYGFSPGRYRALKMLAKTLEKVLSV